MNDLIQPRDAGNLCAYCRRPWFGLVAFCPFCGREPRFRAVDRQPFGTSGSDVATTLRLESPNLPTARTASPLFFRTVAAGLIASVLVWMVAWLLASGTGREASPYPPAPTEAIAFPRPIALTSAAEASSVPRTERPVLPRSGRWPCSAAHHRAGLCTSQE
jgi:hypothetical protein